MDSIETQLINIVQAIVDEHAREKGTITLESSLGNPRAWDSLVFVEIFETVSETFSLDVSDDDAVHFMSIAEMAEFIRSNG